jgi:DNA polymerase-1
VPKKLFLIDGSNHAFRVQFALPPQHSSDGFPTRVLYGFTLLFQKMMRTYRPDYCAVSFDHGKSFRHAELESYKGHRPDMPADMRRQWDYLPELVEGFGYKVLRAEGYEADDVIGSLAKQFASDDVHVYIVSSDKDFAQLIDEHIHLVDDRKGKVLKLGEVAEALGVRADQVVDMKGLAGDSSDNLPGVPGIGPKTAAKLLDQYGGFEEILQAAADGKIKGKRGQNLVAHADDARISRKLARIHTDVDLGVTLDDLAPQGIQEEPLRDLFDQWEFMAVATKLLPHKVAVDKSAYRAITSADELQAMAAEVRSAGRVGVSLRTSDDELLGASFATYDGVAYVPVAPRADVSLSADEARQVVLELLGDPAIDKVTYDAKALQQQVHALGGEVRGSVGDVRLLDYVLVAHRRSHGLDDIAKRHLGHNLAYVPETEPMYLSEVVSFAGEPAQVALLVHRKLVKRLSEGTRSIYEDLELPLVAVLADMERAGILIDRERFDEIAADLRQRVVAAEEAAHEILGRPFKVGSPKEVAEVLFDELGLTKSKRTKTGFSTDASVLEKLVDEHPLPAAILEWRQLQKLESTYVSTLPGYADADGRIHTTFNQAVAATGRLSSADPNLQNIPIRTFEGRRIRDGFVAAPGHVLMSADYSQVELRVLAHCCGSGALVDSFAAGEDIHRRTASEVWKVPMDEVTTELRSAAKAINFGLLYGMSAFRLGRDLSISRSEAQQYMDDYFGRMPQVQEWIESTKQFCRDNGYVETLYGRRRLIPEIYAKSYSDRMAGEREAVNTVVQGTAADIIKRAMLRVHAALAAGDTGARMLLQVHDELLLEVPEDRVDEVADLLREQMMGAAELAVPLAVNVGWGHNWNEAHG